MPGARGSGDEGRVMYMNLDVSVDGLARSAASAGAEAVEGPAGTPWTTREVTFSDPDGYLLTSTSGPVADRTFDEVMGVLSERKG